MLLPEYQINDIEKGLAFFSICQLKFSNSLDSNKPFLPVEIGDFLQEVHFENLQN